MRTLRDLVASVTCCVIRMMFMTLLLYTTSSELVLLKFSCNCPYSTPINTFT